MCTLRFLKFPLRPGVGHASPLARVGDGLGPRHRPRGRSQIVEPGAPACVALVGRATREAVSRNGDGHPARIPIGFPWICCLVAVLGYERKAKMQQKITAEGKQTKKGLRKKQTRKQKPRRTHSGTHELSRKQGWEKKQHRTLLLTEESTTTHKGTLWTGALPDSSTLG